MNLLPIAGLLFAGCLPWQSAAAEALLCGPAGQTAEFKQLYDHCGVATHSVADPHQLAELPLDHFDAIAVCFDNPGRLSPLPAASAEALQNYLAGGGTLYLESCSGFSLPGWSFGTDSMLMKDERLQVTGDTWSQAGLPPETLLEEQNSYCQRVDSPDGDILLTYGVWLGTDTLFTPEQQDQYEIRLALPEPAAIKTITQYYG